MFRNYLKTAWRNLVRQKVFSVINISGLALGMACSLLILLWVQDERSVDGFHKNSRYLYQVYETNYYDGKIDASYPTQGLLAEELKRVVPEVQYASGLEYASAPGSQSTFEAGKKISKWNGDYAGEDFFTMFSYPLLQGTAESALHAPGNVAISRKMAEYFFGSPGKAMGKIIRIDNKDNLLVSAVFENIPSNSSQQFDFLLTWTDFVKDNNWVHNWGNTDPSTFVQLREGADPDAVQTKIRDFIYRYQRKDKSFIMQLGLQPYASKYLHSTFKNGKIDGGRIAYVQLFTAVAIFILLIACINFMNLATAQSSRRAKEVGLRKVIGAMRASLIRQFIGEAMLLAFFSTLIALVIAALLLPAFNSLTGKQVSIPVSSAGFWAAIAGLTLVTGFVSGSYPALFLSSFNPVQVLKGKLKFNWSAAFFRKVLVVFQFALSIILIISMIVIYRQVHYIETKNLGYDRENLLYIPIEGELTKDYTVFKTEALKIPGIVDVSKMRNSPTVIGHHTGSIDWPGKSSDLTISFADGVVGYDFVKTMHLQLKEGRDFSKDFASDSTGFLINETAADKIGFRHPLSQTMTWGNHPGKVIGVLKDFHFNSLHQNIDPLIMRLDENWPWGTILVRIQSGSAREAIAGLGKLCRSLNPRFPFTYQFSDQEFDKLYRSEEVVSRLSGYFAFMAIFLSCLGLFGLAAFTAMQRTKEIGVRKVLGASVPDIVAMLSTHFLKLIVVALVIAIPVAWWTMSRWLEDFAYRINISWWIFIAAGLAAIVIAMFTVGYHAIRAAVANPVQSLRSE